MYAPNLTICSYMSVSENDEAISKIGTAAVNRAAIELTFHATGEASPISEDKQRQLFLPEILNSLGGFVRAVRKPNLSRLRYGFRFRV